jgi:hypothetical protein
MTPQLQTIRYQAEDSAYPPAWVTYIPFRKVWVLAADYRFLHDDLEIIIPYGFEFDLSSIPRIIWPIISSFELSIVAPLIHDYFYRYQGRPVHHNPFRIVSRKEADEIFLEIMRRESVPNWKSNAAFRAVRIFAPRY